MESMTRRDIHAILAILTVTRKKERNMKVFKKQTDAMLQVVPRDTLKITDIVWSSTAVDTYTQTDEQPAGGSYSMEALREMELGGGGGDDMGLSQAALSPVYHGLECVRAEMANKGINNVLLSNWLVNLLAIIRRMNPTSLSFSHYYYKNEARAQGTPPLHMVNVEAGVRFMSAVDNMCTYSTAGTGKGLFSDSELLVHYAVANASRHHNSKLSYVQFCNDPLLYSVQQLAHAINETILDIVAFATKPLAQNEKPQRVNVKWFPPSYVHVVEAVNAILQEGSSVAKQSVLVQFLPLAPASSQQTKADMTNKEIAFLGLITRTALMWYMTYNLSSTVEKDSIIAYEALLNRCMIRDAIVIQSLFNVGKGPYLSTGMLWPGMFAYLFYISKDPAKTTVTVARLSESHNTPSLEKDLHIWCTTDFGVRDKMARFICGDSVLHASVTATTAAFPGTTRNQLQGQIDSAIIFVLRDILILKHAYATPANTVIDFMKERTGTTEYLQVSLGTRTTDYKMTMTDNMARRYMMGFLKNPFLYKVHNTGKLDTFGRDTVHTTRATMVATPVAM